jgi:hypothetical protein
MICSAEVCISIRYRLSICVCIVGLLMDLNFVHERKYMGYRCRRVDLLLSSWTICTNSLRDLIWRRELSCHNA